MPSLPNELWCEMIAHAISFESNLAMVKPSSERLFPKFPRTFYGFGETGFYSSQLAIWKRSTMIAHSFVQVNRLWRGIAERFLYSTLYVEEEWRLQRFIDAIKLNPNLAEQLRTLVIITPICTGVEDPYFGPLVVQLLSLCHGIVAIVMGSYILSRPLPLFQSLGSSRRLLLLSALCLPSEKFPTFMIKLNDYASLQVLELSVTYSYINSHTLPPFPQHTTVPSLHTLVLGDLLEGPLVPNVVGKWELPSLKELAIRRWYPLYTPLLPLIQRSYERLEFFSAPLDLLDDRAFHDITRAPPFHLRHVTLDIFPRSPPIYPATKPLFGHVVTLGICNCWTIKPKDMPAWVRLFSDPTYMPHLRTVLMNTTKRHLFQRLFGGPTLLEVLRPFEKVLEDRGVALKGVMDDHSSFVPIKLLQRSIAVVSTSLFSNASTLISSPASKCSSWELREANT
jgi:hypothetical protein